MDEIASHSPLETPPQTPAQIVETLLIKARHLRAQALALQLPFCFEVRALGGRLMSPAPE